MNQYEYLIIQSPAGGRITHLNERMEGMVAEGWEPIMMTGDATVSVMMRRPRKQTAETPPTGGQTA